MDRDGRTDMDRDGRTDGQTADRERKSRSLTELESLDDDSKLALFLLKLYCDPNCFQRPHIDTLPKSFPTIPTHFSDDDLFLLEGTVVYGMAMQMRIQTEILYESVVEFLIKNFPTEFKAELVTIERLFWAISLITSRAFLVQIDKKSSQSVPSEIANMEVDSTSYQLTCIAPFADFANHSITPTITSLFFDNEKKCLVLRIDPDSNSCITAGEELTLKYGNLENWELFLYYGFVIENNPYDKINIDLEIPDSNSMDLIVKKALFFDLLNDVFSYSQFITEKGISNSLLYSMRLIVSDENELENVTLKNVASLMNSIVSKRNELQVLASLKQLVSALLKNFENSNGPSEVGNWSVDSSSGCHLDTVKTQTQIYT
eukprot:Awhi_evm2s9791